jgi:hypothetical protein
VGVSSGVGVGGGGLVGGGGALVVGGGGGVVVDGGGVGEGVHFLSLPLPGISHQSIWAFAGGPTESATTTAHTAKAAAKNLRRSSSETRSSPMNPIRMGANIREARL